MTPDIEYLTGPYVVEIGHHRPFASSEYPIPCCAAGSRGEMPQRPAPAEKTRLFPMWHFVPAESDHVIG